MTPADAATAMHSYSGHLMQFASGVDTETALFYGRRTSSERTARLVASIPVIDQNSKSQSADESGQIGRRWN
jgi:hypothetical protein